MPDYNHNHGAPALATGSLRPEEGSASTENTGQQPHQLPLPIHVSPAALTAEPDPRRWLQQAALAWTELNGPKMTVRWARDVAIIKPLLRLHGWDELTARWKAYINTDDLFFATRGWNIPTFSTCVDRFAGGKDRAAYIAMQQMRPIRDRLSGEIRGYRRGW